MLKSFKKVSAAFAIAAAAAAMLICSSTVAMASETQEHIYTDGSGCAEYNGQSDVSYHVYSHYTVSIPVVIDASTNYTGRIEVTMDNIESGYHINAYVSNLEGNKLFVTNQKGKMSGLFVNYNDINIPSGGLIDSLYPADFTDENDMVARLDVQLVPEDTMTMAAGTYTGAMCFKIECVQD